MMDDTSKPSRAPDTVLPRLIRFRDAPRYLGMDRNRFNAEVRGCVTEIPIGAQGVAFDRLELDAWVDQYKARNGRPGQSKGELILKTAVTRFRLHDSGADGGFGVGRFRRGRA